VREKNMDDWIIVESIDNIKKWWKPQQA